MKTAAVTPDHDLVTDTATSRLHIVEQLTLLPTYTTPSRFQLSKDTRERGLRHVAEIRQMLADRAALAATSLDNVQRVPARHEQAA